MAIRITVFCYDLMKSFAGAQDEINPTLAF